LVSGPVIHMWEGIVHVKTEELDFDRSKGELRMRVVWTNSYEASTHVAAFGRSEAPVCHTLTGYASGWGSTFIGKPVVAIEERCVGKGDDACLGVLRMAEDWGPEADPWKEALAADLSLSRELQKTSMELEAKKRALSAVSTPIIQVWDSVVVVPVIGVIDAQRSTEMTEALLRRVASDGIQRVIFDVTGVEAASATLIEELVKLSEATRLLGASAILSGVRSDMASSLVEAGIDTSRLSTCRTLRDGLDLSLKQLGYTVTRTSPRAY
jgi:rsbT co-antagonist protein RsbR